MVHVLVVDDPITVSKEQKEGVWEVSNLLVRAGGFVEIQTGNVLVRQSCINVIGDCNNFSEISCSYNGHEGRRNACEG